MPKVVRTTLLDAANERIYSEREFTNGRSYKSALVRGELGARPADLILLRIAEDRDKFVSSNKKCLVLTTSSSAAQLMKERLPRAATDLAARKYLLENSTLINSVKNNEKAAKVNFFDFNKLRISIGQAAKRDPDRTNEIIREHVAEFVKAKELLGTEQIYITNAEEFTTEIGYKILQELATQLIPNRPPQIFALAQHDYSHGSNGNTKTLAQVFGPATILQPLSNFVGEVPNLVYHRAKLPDAGTKPEDLDRIARSDEFNSRLVEQIEESITRGDKRIFVRVRDTHALDVLVNKLKDKKISTAWFSSNGRAHGNHGACLYDAKSDAQHQLNSPRLLLAHWGNDSAVLVHCGIFDRLEEPADSVIVADRVISPDEFENVITPLRTRGKRTTQDAHLYGFSFADDKFSPRDAIDGYDRRMRYGGQGNCRSINCKSAGAATGHAPSAEPAVDSGDFVGRIIDLSDRQVTAINAYWRSIINNDQLLASLRSYLRTKSSQSNLQVLDEPRELRYLIELINNQRPVWMPQFEHNRREVCEHILRGLGLDITEQAAKYPAILGIEKLQEAQLRVFNTYKQQYAIYDRLPSSSGLDQLASVPLNGQEARWRHRANLIGEFLFTSAPRELLTEQDLHDGRVDNSSLENTLTQILSVGNMPDENRLAINFQSFVTKKTQDLVAAKGRSGIAFGIGKDRWQALVDDYIERELPDLILGDAVILEQRHSSLVEALRNESPVAGMAPQDSYKFFRYLASCCPDKLKLGDLVRQRPDLVGLATQEEKQSRLCQLLQEVTLSKNAGPWLKRLDEIISKRNTVTDIDAARSEVILGFLEARNRGFDSDAKLNYPHDLEVLSAASLDPTDRPLLRDFMQYICSKYPGRVTLPGLKAEFLHLVGVEGPQEALDALKFQLRKDLDQYLADNVLTKRKKNQDEKTVGSFFNTKVAYTMPVAEDAPWNYINNFCRQYGVLPDELFGCAATPKPEEHYREILQEMPDLVAKQATRIINDNANYIRAVFLINSLLPSKLQEQKLELPFGYTSDKGWHALIAEPHRLDIYFKNGAYETTEELNFRVLIAYFAKCQDGKWKQQRFLWKERAAELLAAGAKTSVKAIEGFTLAPVEALSRPALKPDKHDKPRDLLSEIKKLCMANSDSDLIAEVRSYVEDAQAKNTSRSHYRWDDLANHLLLACGGEVFAGSGILLVDFFNYLLEKYAIEREPEFNPIDFVTRFSKYLDLDDLLNQLKTRSKGLGAEDDRSVAKLCAGFMEQSGLKIHYEYNYILRKILSRLEEQYQPIMEKPRTEWTEAEIEELRMYLGFIKTIGNNWSKQVNYMLLRQLLNDEARYLRITLPDCPKKLIISIEPNARDFSIRVMDKDVISAEEEASRTGS